MARLPKSSGARDPHANGAPAGQKCYPVSQEETEEWLSLMRQCATLAALELLADGVLQDGDDECLREAALAWFAEGTCDRRYSSGQARLNAAFAQWLAEYIVHRRAALLALVSGRPPATLFAGRGVEVLQ